MLGGYFPRHSDNNREVRQQQLPQTYSDAFTHSIILPALPQPQSTVHCKDCRLLANPNILKSNLALLTSPNNRQMLLMKESEMEGRTEKISPPPPPKAVRTKREAETTARDKKHKVDKAVKLQEPHKRKERTKDEDAGEEHSKEDKKEVSSTVINVDSVRQRTNKENEELLGLLESEWHEDASKLQRLGVCELLLTIAALATVIFFFPISIWFCVKIVREYERAVVFRLGHLLERKPRGPGLLFYLPFLDVCHKVDIRVVTKDLVCTQVSAVCYYRVENVSVCYSSLAGVPAVLQALVQVSVREVLAHHTFTSILQKRSEVAHQIQLLHMSICYICLMLDFFFLLLEIALDSIACRWGIKVERAEIEDLFLPPELQQNFAVEAEAKRQAQIQVIAAEGEKAACEALKASIDSLSDSPLAIQLRLLQLLQTMRSDQPAVLLSLPPALYNQSLQLADTRSTTNQSQPTGEVSEEVAKDSPMM
ncbi:podocin-like [Clarias magur]|uniref:Podocin-like n=1 Tax=Clarias magur TaxID=1594786 RepID=A0A8J4U2Z1_CLAMG|nr:podocin-like [Clarias magur]